MKSTIFASALLAGTALSLPAAAQTYGTDEVTVNPQATSGSQLLLYPGGRYGRLVHPLLQPGQADPNAPIHLHMPYPHKHVVHVAKAKPKTQTASATPPSPPPQQHQSAPQPDMLNFGPIPGESAVGMVQNSQSSTPAKKVASAPPKAPPPAPKKVIVAQKPPTSPKQTPAPPPKKTAAAPTQVTSDFGSDFLYSNQSAAAPSSKPVKTASVEPSDAKGLTKRSSIPFSPGAEEPAPEVLDTVKNVSTELNSALSNGSARVDLQAFGGKPNDKSSDARRISLKRALIVRQLLIDEGVPSERIDVHAMGGASDGSPDRVDIFVRS